MGCPPLTPKSLPAQLTCPSKAATLAVFTTSPRWPSGSGVFWLIRRALRRITLKVPTRLTCRTKGDGDTDVIPNPVSTPLVKD